MLNLFYLKGNNANTRHFKTHIYGRVISIKVESFKYHILIMGIVHSTIWFKWIEKSFESEANILQYTV